MKMLPEQFNRLLYLLGALRDEVITADEFLELNTMLQDNSEAQEYYLDYIYLCTDLCNLQAAVKQDVQQNMDIFNPPLTMDMLRILGEYERKAEPLELPEADETENFPVRKIPINIPPREIPKRSMITLAISIAAVLCVIIYVHLNPRSSFEVATLSEAVGAQWSSSLPLQKGTRLSASSSGPIQLQKGVIEIRSDKDVIITLEAPAEFSFISPDEIVIKYGRLFASVPPVGSGFSVQTHNSKIIDLGTNFGVYSDMTGETELHVFKGKTILIAGQKGQDKKTVEVSGGQARRVNSDDSDVADIALNHNMFAQGIDSETGLLITGGKQIDLADIVGGGDGTGNGNKNRGIQWDGRELLSGADLLGENPGAFPKNYVPVNCNPLIDGIFVPNCKGEEPLMLTSSVSTLNLDDFIASDTNGQVTLVLLHENADDNATYWICSKEGAENEPDKCPTLTFPNASPIGPSQITTAYKNGADAYVSNDTLRGPTAKLGKISILSCRHREGEKKRIRIIFLRFDISDIKGDLTNAVLDLYLNFGNRRRDLSVYGLKDGPAENWDEATISFNTAPGLLPTELGNYQLDENAFDLLGTFHVVDNRISTDPTQVTADKAYSWSAPSTQQQSASVISNGDRYVDAKGSVQTFMLDNVFYGTDQNPSVFMHANAGITFDLEAIRRVYGPVSIESFTAACGISKPASTSENYATQPAASFYVLVNGQEVFSSLDMSPEDPPQLIDIELNRQARYLTLVATQGTDNSITNDICLFAKPILNLK